MGYIIINVFASQKWPVTMWGCYVVTLVPPPPPPPPPPPRVRGWAGGVKRQVNVPSREIELQQSGRKSKCLCD